MMDRQKLIDGLRNVDPARSILQQGIVRTFWFTGNRLMAYNGNIALSVSFKSEWAGAVQETLYPLLNSSAAKEVEFVQDEKGFVCKAGSSKFKLLTLSNNDFVFTMPKLKDDDIFPVDVGRFLIALKACKRSLGGDTSESSFRGVTLIAKGKTLHMFGFDRVTLTHATVALKGDPGFERIIIPQAGVNELLRITDGETELRMRVDDGYLLCRSGGVTLYSRLDDIDRNERDFIGQANELRSEAGNKMNAVPAKIAAMLERACVVTQAAVDVTKTKITIADNKIFFVSKSPRGEVNDATMFEKGDSHGDVSLSIDPRRVLDAVELTHCAFSPRAVILSNEEETIRYFVSGA